MEGVLHSIPVIQCIVVFFEPFLECLMVEEIALGQQEVLLQLNSNQYLKLVE